MAKKKKRKPDSAYWKKRFTSLEASQNAYAAKTTADIVPGLEKAQRQVQSKIESWIARFATNNEISMKEARRQLSTKELAEFRWTVQEYIKYGRENAIDERWMKELENASARFHVSRLQALQIDIQQAIEVAYGNELDEVDSMLKHLYTEEYYHTIFEVQRGFNIGFHVDSVNQGKLERILSNPWAADGKTFSSRIWTSKAQMLTELQQQLVRQCAMGKAPDDAIRALSKFVDKKFKNAKAQAGRLVMTEEAFISAAAQKEAFKELDVEEFEIVATLDSHTSDICQDMDGKHFPMSQYEIGITAPPFHVWCRSTTCPYFNDEWSGGERAAKGEDGKTYYVPDSMTYPEWKEAFVEDAISTQTRKEFAKYSEILGNNPMTIEDFVKIKYNDEEWKLFKSFTSSIKSGELSALADFNLYKNISDEMDEKLLGVVTSNGMTITGKSNHSIARVIGSIEQRRNGVQVSDVLDALTSKEAEVLPIKTMKNGRSQKFRNNTVEVSVNPDTGNIIQVNPVHKRRKKVES